MKNQTSAEPILIGIGQTITTPDGLKVTLNKVDLPSSAAGQPMSGTPMYNITLAVGTSTKTMTFDHRDGSSGMEYMGHVFGITTQEGKYFVLDAAYYQAHPFEVAPKSVK